jgi:hypothetical protein
MRYYITYWEHILQDCNSDLAFTGLFCALLAARLLPPPPPEVSKNVSQITSSSATLSWIALTPLEANGPTISYTVNLVAVSSDAESDLQSRRKREAMSTPAVVTHCVMRNGGSMESNVTVRSDQTSLEVENLGELLL